jgi:hypothetical protein
MAAPTEGVPRKVTEIEPGRLRLQTATDEAGMVAVKLGFVTLTEGLRGSHSGISSRSGGVGLQRRPGASPSLVPPF